MGEWKEYSLKDIADFSQGIQIPLEDQKVEPFAGCVRFIRIVDFTKENSNDIRYINNPGNRYIVNEDDLVMIRYGSQTAGKIARGFSGAIANNTFKILPNQNVLDKNFLFYYLSQKSIFEHFHFAQASSTMPAITFDMIGNLIINVPQVYDQRTIASILSSLDDKIDLLHRQNKTLEALAETLFRHWFVEEADESWEVGTLDDEFDFTMGQSPKGNALNESNIGIIFYQGRTDFGFRFPNPRVYTTTTTRLAKKFDTLVSVRAPVGDMNMAIEECCLGRGVAAFRYKASNDFYSYTYYKMRSLVDQIKQYEDSGTVFGSIGKEDFKKLDNIIPSIELVNEFQKIVKPIDDKIYSNTNQIRTLAQLRDTLLPRLMSGEVRVKN